MRIVDYTWLRFYPDCEYECDIEGCNEVGMFALSSGADIAKMLCWRHVCEEVGPHPDVMGFSPIPENMMTGALEERAYRAQYKLEEQNAAGTHSQ